MLYCFKANLVHGWKGVIYVSDAELTTVTCGHTNLSSSLTYDILGIQFDIFDRLIHLVDLLVFPRFVIAMTLLPLLCLATTDW